MTLLALTLAFSAGASIRVMSYNVRLGVAKDGDNSWENRREATPAMLRDIRPAVFGVQEAYDFQIAYILEQCPEYKAVGVGRDDGKSDGEHMSVFYDSTRIELLNWGTYWLSETPDVPSFGWDAKCRRTATWTLLREIASGQKFYFVNTHLDHIGVMARKNGLALIYNKIKEMNPSGLPMVLTGDFNILPDNDGLTDLNTLMKSARFYSDDADTIGSFNGFGKYGLSSGAPKLGDSQKDKKTLRPLDYIYYSGFERSLCFKVVTKSYAGKKFISDHYPVYGERERQQQDSGHGEEVQRVPAGRIRPRPRAEVSGALPAARRQGHLQHLDEELQYEDHRRLADFFRLQRAYDHRDAGCLRGGSGPRRDAYGLLQLLGLEI